MTYSRDPDDLHGDEKTHVIEIAIRRNGAMSIAGSINDRAFALAMLDSARDAINNHHKRGNNLIIPSHDTALAGVTQ